LTVVSCRRKKQRRSRPPLGKWRKGKRGRQGHGPLEGDISVIREKKKKGGTNVCRKTSTPDCKSRKRGLKGEYKKKRKKDTSHCQDRRREGSFAQLSRREEKNPGWGEPLLEEGRGEGGNRGESTLSVGETEALRLLDQGMCKKKKKRGGLKTKGEVLLLQEEGFIIISYTGVKKRVAGPTLWWGGKGRKGEGGRTFFATTTQTATKLTPIAEVKKKKKKARRKMSSRCRNLAGTVKEGDFGSACVPDKKNPGQTAG